MVLMRFNHEPGASIELPVELSASVALPFIS